MGLSNRDYFQDDDSYLYGERPRGPQGPMTATAIVTIVIAVSYVATTLMGSSASVLRLTPEAVRGGWIWQVLTYGFTADPGGRQVIWFFVLMALLFWSLSHNLVESYIGRIEYFWLFFGSIVGGGLIASLLPGNQLSGMDGARVGPQAIVVWAAMKHPRYIIHVFGVIPVPLWVIGAVDVIYAVWPTIGGGGEGRLLLHPAVGAMAVAASHQYVGWRFTTFRESLKSLKPKPKLKVYAPEEKRGEEDEFAAKVDEILAKISRDGEASLTSKERKILKQASQKYKGRV